MKNLLSCIGYGIISVTDRGRRIAPWCGDCKRRVIALLDQVFPEYDKLFSDTFGSTSKE